MPNNLFRKLIQTRIKDFLEVSDSIVELSHKGMEGEIREFGFRNLISFLLPIDWGVGTGKIIDNTGRISNQMDIIIFYRRVFPSIFIGELGLYPLESSGFAIEVKTMSTAAEIKKTIRIFQNLNKFEEVMPFSEYTPWLRIKPRRVYFALNSDLQVEDELERYSKYDPNWCTDPAVQIILISKKGCWIFAEGDEQWHFYSSDEDSREYFAFFSVLVDQINIIVPGAVKASRYWIEDRTLSVDRIISNDGSDGLKVSDRKKFMEENSDSIDW
jgi:hypothetical protein